MQIVTYYADWQTGFHADVRYEGTASYPEDYNNNNNGAYPSSKQYGSSGVNSGYNSGTGTNQYATTNNNNIYNGNSGYNSATSSVSIKDFSGPGTPYTTNNYDNDAFNYNSNDFNNGYSNYDSFSGYSNKGRINSGYGTH